MRKWEKRTFTEFRTMYKEEIFSLFVHRTMLPGMIFILQMKKMKPTEVK